MEFKVYWTYGGECFGEAFQDVAQALDRCQELRNSGHSFVTMCSQDVNMVGKFGVDSVEHGLLPDGDVYTWKKRRL
jgi:hypothetical protein